MAIDGFSVKLGKPVAGGNLQSMVRREDIASLLAQARKDPNFEKSKDSYEFRLRKNGGQAVLELRKPTTGFFAKLFQKGRRSQERVAAYEAIRQHMTLLSSRKDGDLRKKDARDLAKGVIGHLNELIESRGAERALYGLRIGQDAIKYSLSSVLKHGLNDRVLEERPLGLDVRSQTMTLLDRAQVSTNRFGQLVIKSPAQSGNGHSNLDAIVNFFRDKCAPIGGPPLSLDSTGDDRLKNLVEGFLLHIRAGTERAMSSSIDEGMMKTTGFESFAKGRELEVVVNASDYTVAINFSQSGELAIGPQENPGKIFEFASKMEFSMQVDKLMGGLSEAGDLNLYRDVDLHLGPNLSQTERTELEQANDRALAREADRSRKYEAQAEERKIAEDMRTINRGPTKSPFGEN